MSGTQRTIYLTEEASKEADKLVNLSKWVQKKLIQHGIEHAGPETQTHRVKEAARWNELIYACLKFVKDSQDIAHLHGIPRTPTKLMVENWAHGYRHEINVLDLTEAQFVEKVMEQVKE